MIAIRRTGISPNGTIFNVVILGQSVRGNEGVLAQLKRET
jgi:hypothetical protein